VRLAEAGRDHRGLGGNNKASASRVRGDAPRPVTVVEAEGVHGAPPSQGQTLVRHPVILRGAGCLCPQVRAAGAPHLGKFRRPLHRQEMVRGLLEDEGEAMPLAFVGSASLQNGVPAVVASIANELGFDPLKKRGGTADDLFRELRAHRSSRDLRACGRRSRFAPFVGWRKSVSRLCDRRPNCPLHHHAMTGEG
jgi:hypothetical protein